MITKKLLAAATLIVASFSAKAQIGIHTAEPNQKSSLDVVSKNRNTGTLLTRLTTAERSTINPGANENGLTIFNTTTGCYNVWVWSTADSSGSWYEQCGQKPGMVDFTNCNLITVQGIYDIGKPVSQQDVSITVPVRVTGLGSYNYTATVNGVTFAATGVFTNMGNQNVVLYPISGVPGGTGPYNATVTISPTNAGGTGGMVCNNVSVKFSSRATSTLKIVNISGSNTTTGLISGCTNSNSNAGGKTGIWLLGGVAPAGGSVGTALSYAGTQNITVTCVSATSVTEVSDALADASIVYLNGRVSSQANTATTSLVRDWVNAGKGILIDQGDETSELPFAEALGYFVEAGASATGTVIPGNLSQVLLSPTGYTLPYATPTSIPAQGTNGAYIATNIFGTVKYGVVASNNTRNLMVANIDNNTGVFIFGDKYGDNSDVSTAQLFTNIFAWALHNAPVY